VDVDVIYFDCTVSEILQFFLLMSPLLFHAKFGVFLFMSLKTYKTNTSSFTNAIGAYLHSAAS